MVMSDSLLLKQWRGQTVRHDALDGRKVPATEALLQFKGMKLGIRRQLVDDFLCGPGEVDRALWDLLSPHWQSP